MAQATKMVKIVWAFLATSILAGDFVCAQDHTIFTDADAGVRIICRNDWTEEQCLVPAGGEHTVISGWEDHPRYVTVKDQNNLDVGYWHFNLSDLDDNSQITQARFQLDLQTNSWGDTSVSVFAIVEPNSDWDLNALPENEINGPSAPQSDWDSFAWTGDPVDGLQRFNAPTPFLDEGNTPSAIVRELESLIVIENQDPITDGTPEAPGNSYGGFVCCDLGPGEAGSSSHADNGDNIWPVKNAVDVDITELIKWKLGQNPTYSNFPPTDRELTILVRTDFGGGENGFANFIAKESEFLGGELDLAPGRIALSGNIIIGPVGPTLRAGDADQDLDFDQLDLVRVQIAAKYLTGETATWGQGDWNGAPGGHRGDPPPGDGRFDQLDIVAALAPGHYLIGPYAAIGAGGGALSPADSIHVPEPSAVVLAILGLVGVLVGWGWAHRPARRPRSARVS